ncbi:MAG: hypothetical protein ABL993_13105 [Vicinamibacterales bacterium]
MRRLAAFALVVVCGATEPMFGRAASGEVADQARRGRAAAPAAPLTEPAQLVCPSPLGTGVRTRRTFCDVLTGGEPADGIVVTVPPHAGTAVIIFDLHNRHLYSEELVKSNRAYRLYTATIGVLTPDNTLLSRAVIRNEFRTAADLVDRIASDTGAGSMKAVAPTGLETVRITIPEDAASVSILGEKLSVIRPDGTDTFSAPGRPVAVISNVLLEYRPAPARRPASRRR